MQDIGVFLVFYFRGVRKIRMRKRIRRHVNRRPLEPFERIVLFLCSLFTPYPSLSHVDTPLHGTRGNRYTVYPVNANSFSESEG